MPVDKEFKTVFDQIRLLKSRNLHIGDLALAKEHLLNKNYFNLINGFETLLLDDPKISPKTYTKKSLDDFLRLYEFDSKLSSLILLKISEFEVKLKTSIAYHFSKNHCSTLLENSNYINIHNYCIPRRTDGPKKYIDYFYTERNPKKTHKLFRNNYVYSGKFRGTFTGNVSSQNSKTILKGTFKGRFGSTSIKEVNGSCTLLNSKYRSLLGELKKGKGDSNDIEKVKLNIDKNEKMYGLNYIDHCKTKYPFINEYNTPPFWAVIKTLMLNDLILLIYGLKKRTLNNILNDFDLKPSDREKFINSIEIIKELRNTCAHFELVNRFRTSQTLKINAHMISEMNLTPMRSQYVIKLYDVLKVLRMYVDLFDIKIFLWSFWNKELKYNNLTTLTALFDRMGNPNIKDWI